MWTNIFFLFWVVRKLKKSEKTSDWIWIKKIEDIVWKWINTMIYKTILFSTNIFLNCVTPLSNKYSCLTGSVQNLNYNILRKIAKNYPYIYSGSHKIFTSKNMVTIYLLICPITKKFLHLNIKVSLKYFNICKTTRDINNTASGKLFCNF